MNKFKWINIFVRDIALAITLLFINIMVNFNSWTVAFLTGAVFVLASWHLSEILNSVKRIKQE